MNIQNIITKQNIKIINLLAEKSYSIRELAETAKCSPGKAHSTVKLLSRFNIIKTKKQKNKIMTKINRKNPLYQKIKAMLNIFSITSKKSFKQLKKTGIIGIYGSYANGKDTKESDIDLWLFTNQKEITIRYLIRNMEKELKKQINLLILNKNKLEQIKQKDKEFYIRLKLTSIQLNGDIFE